MKQILKPLAPALMMALFALSAPQAQAANCSAQQYDMELAFDTADYICGTGNVDLCAYAMDRAMEAYSRWVDCEYHDAGGPL
jgi:hypothetical protein